MDYIRGVRDFLWRHKYKIGATAAGTCPVSPSFTKPKKVYVDLVLSSAYSYHCVNV